MTLMMMYTKLISVSINYKDGYLIKNGQSKKVSKRQTEYSIAEKPTFIEFMSYIFFCGGAISGPWYEYKDFRNFINKEAHYKQIPSTFKPAMIRFV